MTSALSRFESSRVGARSTRGRVVATVTPSGSWSQEWRRSRAANARHRARPPRRPPPSRPTSPTRRLRLWGARGHARQLQPESRGASCSGSAPHCQWCQQCSWRQCSWHHRHAACWQLQRPAAGRPRCAQPLVAARRRGTLSKLASPQPCRSVPLLRTARPTAARSVSLAAWASFRAR